MFALKASAISEKNKKGEKLLRFTIFTAFTNQQNNLYNHV
jgi:hypothetical protein